MSRVGNEDEIRKCFNSWTKCYNDGNLDGYLEAYADSEKTRYVSGSDIIIGKEKIKELVHSRGVKGMLSLDTLQIDFISEQNAICFGQYMLQLSKVQDKDMEYRKGCFTVHLKKIEDQWKIVSDHSS